VPQIRIARQSEHSSAPPLALLAARALPVVVGLSLALVAVCAAFYALDRAGERERQRARNRAVVARLADEVEAGLGQMRSDLAFLAEQSALQTFLAADTPRNWERLAHDFVHFVEARGVYDQARVLDSGGRELVRVNFQFGSGLVVPRAALQDKSDRYYFTDAIPLDRGEVYVSPLDLNVEHDVIESPLKPMVRVATPIYDALGAKRGLVILNYLGKTLLDRIAAAAGQVDGSVLLMRADGQFLKGPTPADEWGFMLPGRATFATLFPEAWKALAASGDGDVTTDEGLVAFRQVAWPDAGRAGPSAPLVLAAVTPPARLYARSHELLRTLAWVMAIVEAMLLGLVIAISYGGAVRQAQRERLARSDLDLRRLSLRLLRAQEDERGALARDLHDDLGQILAAINLKLQLAAAQAAPGGANVALLTQAQELTRTVVGKIHELSARLRPSVLDDMGLGEALQTLAQQMETDFGLVVDVDLELGAEPVPATVAESVYRLAQEALSNVARHAAVDRARLAAGRSPAGVELIVADAGRGFAPDAVGQRRLGIRGMRERLELLGGVLELRSAPGRGTVVRCLVPYGGAEIETEDDPS
jgi:signal transduction histidine kinase